MGRLPRHRVPRRRRTSTSRAAISSRSIATSPSCTKRSPRRCPSGCVVDGEIVIATPARARLRRAADAAPSGGVARGQARARDARRPSSPSTCWRWTAATSATCPRPSAGPALEALLADVEPPVHLTPMTRDAALAADWLARFEGAGLDGVIAKPEAGPYAPGKRTMMKVKHVRTADCVVAGLPLAQDRARNELDRLAAARPLRRRAERCSTSA